MQNYVKLGRIFSTQGFQLLDSLTDALLAMQQLFKNIDLL